jgi:hypothetical protein
MDNGILADLSQITLVRAGCQVSITDSEQNASSLLQSGKFDLLILPQILPNHDLAFNFLKKWRSSTKNSDVLTMMVTPKDGYDGIVRSPAYPDQAHAYIRGPFAPEKFIEVIAKLLEGASTQRLPGDEGYTKYESKDLGIAFRYPAFWTVWNWQNPPVNTIFRRSSIEVMGPLNRYQSVNSGIVVAIYHPYRPVEHLKYEEMIASEFMRMKDVHQIALEHTSQIGGVQGKEAEYIWSAVDTPTHEHSMWRRKGEQGRLIAATVQKPGAVYILSLMAAADEFEDFRPVYTQLLTTFQFL